MRKIGNLFSSLTVWGHLFMILLSVMSVFLFRERIIFFDSAYYSIKLINSEWFTIESGRYSTLITQILPLLAIKLGASLKTVLVLYSLSFMIIVYAIFIINVHVLKNIAAGFAIVLLSTLCMRDSYFYVVSELIQGMMFSSLLYAWLFYPITTGKRLNPVVNLFVSFTIVLACFYFHPMVMLAVGFIIGFYIIDTRDFTNLNILLLIILTISMYVLKILTANTGSYEGEFISQFKEVPSMLRKLGSLYSTMFFFERYFNFYLIFNIMTWVIALFYLAKRRWAKLLWFLGCLVGFTLLCIVAFNKGDTYIAMEKYFMPLSIFVAIPFLHDFMSGKTLRIIGVVACVCIGLWGTRRIYRERKTYINRIEYIANLNAFATQTHGTRKLVVRGESLDPNRTTWALSAESLLLSAIDGKEKSTTVFAASKTQLTDIDFSDTKTFLCAPFDLKWTASSLNPEYFMLPETPYLFTAKGVDDVDSSTLMPLKTFSGANNIETNEEYYLLLECPLSDLHFDNKKYVDVKASATFSTLVEPSRDLKLVMSLESGFYLSSAYLVPLPKDSSGAYTFSISISSRIRSKIGGNDMLKIYAWNKDKQAMKIRSSHILTGGN